MTFNLGRRLEAYAFKGFHESESLHYLRIGLQVFNWQRELEVTGCVEWRNLDAFARINNDYLKAQAKG